MKPITAYKKLGITFNQYAPNHTVVITKSGQAFVRYTSVVAFLGTDGTLTLGPNWDYSRTTTKYLGQWLGKNKAEITKAIEQGLYKVDPDL